jgi:hypothetical protein
VSVELVSFEERVHIFVAEPIPRTGKGRLWGGVGLMPHLCLLLYSPQLKVLVAADGYQYQHLCERNG